MCWNITGSPPPAALKKLVPKWRSVSSIVTDPASTGMTAISRYAVINQVQTNSGIFISVMPGARMLRMVVMMLIDPMIDDALHDVHGEDGHVHAHAGLHRQRRIQRPAGACGTAGNEKRPKQQRAGERQQPETPVVHARECHVRSADHHRYLPVGETHRRGHDRAEDHDQAVHRIELVEKFRSTSCKLRARTTRRGWSAPRRRRR